MSNDNDTALVVGEKSGELVNPSQFEAWAEVFVKSGLFAPPEGGRGADILVQVAQAKVKILAGMEMGLQPFFSMQNLYIVKQHIFISASAYAALANSGDSMMVTTESTTERATIEFYRFIGGERKLVHTQAYTWEEVPANRKGLATYQSDKADMIWNRCMTKGGHKAIAYKVGNLKTLEEAHDDDGDFTETPLIPEELPASNAVDEAMPQSTLEPGAAAQPKTRHRRTNAEIKADAALASKSVESTVSAGTQPEGEIMPTEADIEPGDAPVVDGDPTAAGRDRPGDLPFEPDETEDSGELITPDQATLVSVWYLTEKFDINEVARDNGWKLKDIGSMTQVQFEVMKEERRAYIKRLSVEFGWDRKDDELDRPLTVDQHGQAKAKHTKNLKNA